MESQDSKTTVVDGEEMTQKEKAFLDDVLFAFKHTNLTIEDFVWLIRGLRGGYTEKLDFNRFLKIKSSIKGRQLMVKK